METLKALRYKLSRFAVVNVDWPSQDDVLRYVFKWNASVAAARLDKIGEEFNLSYAVKKL